MIAFRELSRHSRSADDALPNRSEDNSTSRRMTSEVHAYVSSGSSACEIEISWQHEL